MPTWVCHKTYALVRVRNLEEFENRIPTISKPSGEIPVLPLVIILAMHTNQMLLPLVHTEIPTWFVTHLDLRLSNSMFL